MKRRWKVLLWLGVGLVALLVLNTIVVSSETKPASITARGGQILQLPGGDMQVVDTPARSSHPGAPIVLIPCYACSLHWYDRMVPLLAKNHRVIQLDLIGEGGSAKPANGYEMESEAQDVAAALNKLGIQGAVVVGHSLGGAVATSLAQQASQLVDRLVIIDQAPDNSYGGVPLLAKVATWPVIGQALRRVTPDGVIKSTYDSAFAPGYDISSGFDNPDQVVDDYHAMTFTSYTDLASEEDDFESAESLDSRIRSAAVPLMVIFGAEDQIWDDTKAAADAYSSVPGAEIRMIPGAGHSPNVEKPAATAALIERFAPETAPAPPAPPKPRRRPKHPASCDQPQTKQVETEIRSPRPGSPVKSPFVAHVASALPRCTISVSITVDGRAYAFEAPKNKHGGVGPNNPLATKPLHLHGKAKRRYAKSPSCSSGHAIYFQLKLPKGSHLLRAAGCPQGKGQPRTTPAGVHFHVR